MSDVKKTVIPALLGAAACLFFLRSGFFAFFFLAPLGFVAFRYDYRAAWLGLLFAAAGNALISGGIALARNYPAAETGLGILYFSVTAALFVWLAAPPPRFSGQAPGVIRFIIASSLGAVLSTVIFFKTIAAPEFSESINSLVSLFRSSGSNVVENALLESINAETVLDLMKAVMLRGGGLVSSILLFFISRQIGFTLARLSRRERSGSFLLGFHVKPELIWALSVSLLLVVLTRMMKLEIPEIILWNILVLCVILYLAQGFGILQFFLTRTRSHFMRFFLHLLFVILLFSPGINAVLLGGIVLLGIAENWVSFRAPKQDGPPSTPEAGGED